MKTASDASPDPFALVGATLGQTYLIEGVIGEGAHGVLYTARHLRLSCRCAVKLISLPAGPRREALLCAVGSCAGALHPYLSPPFDAMALSPDTLLLGGPLLDGEDLQNRVALRGKLTQAEGQEVVRQAAAGLLSLHRRGLVHGNLRARNVFLARYDDVAVDSPLHESQGAQQVRLLDMGLYHCDALNASMADDQRALAQLTLDVVADLTLPQRRVLEKAQSARQQGRYPSMQEFFSAFQAAAPLAPVTVQPAGPGHSVVRGAPMPPGSAASTQTAVVPRGKGRKEARETFVLPKIKRPAAARPPAPRLPRTLFRLLVILGACVVAVALGGAAAVLFKQRQLHTVATESPELSKLLLPGAGIAAPGPPPGGKPASLLKAGKPGGKGGVRKAAPPEQVKLRFVLSPPDAQVQVGGETVPTGSDLQVPRQKQALSVLAQAPGYLPYESTVIPDADRTVNIALLAQEAPAGRATDHGKKHHRHRKKPPG